MDIKSWKAWRVLAIGFILLSILAGFPLYSNGAEPIKIGVIQPLTGPIAFDGQNQVKAIELAVEKINSGGGVLGRQIKLFIEDGKALPTESKSAALKLIAQDKVRAILGCWASSATLAVMPLLDEHHIPMINGTSTSDKITNPNTPGWYWTFRLLAPHQITAEDVVPALVKFGFTKDVGYLAFSNEWGRNVVPNFKRQFEKFNVKDVFEEYFDAGTMDLMPLFSRAKAKGVKALFLNGDTLALSIQTKQSYEAGMGGIPRVLVMSGDMKQIMSNAGKEAAEGVFQIDYYHPDVDNPGNKELTPLWRQKYPDQMTYQAQASGYSQGKLIAKAIEMAKSDNPAAIRDALEKIQMDTPFGLTKFDKFHQATPFHVINQVKAGKPVLVWWSGR